MTRWMTVSLGGSSLGLALLLGSCGSMDPAGEIELQATAQANINGMQAELKGQFRIETEGQRLRGGTGQLRLLYGDGHFLLLGQTNRDHPARRASDGCAGGRPVRTKYAERANRSPSELRRQAGSTGRSDEFGNRELLRTVASVCDVPT
jgi:hypothetical protein